MSRLLAVALALAAVPAARAETRPGYGGKVEAPLLGAPATFDPAAAQSHAELTLVELLYDTLYRVTVNGELVPHLAVDLPELDAEKTTARIAIRKGVRFHDGSVLTAQDVAASLDRARQQQGRWALSGIAAVKANGDTLELTLRGGAVDVAAMLALAPSAITPRGKPPGGRPIGTGAFRFASIDRKPSGGAAGTLVLEAFDDHFAGRTYLDRLVLRWHDQLGAEAKRFELDELQLSARGASAFVGGQPKYRASAVESPRALLLFVGFGKKHADVLRDPAFRRALDLALDRGALASSYHGDSVIPAGEPVPVEAGGLAPTLAVRSGDPGEAKRARDEAATRVAALQPANLSRLTLEIAYEQTRPDDRDLAERVARALMRLGIAASLAPLSATELRDRVARGTTDLWIGQLAAPIKQGTAWPWWTAAFAAGGDDWAAAQLAAGTLTIPAARKEYAARRPIVPLVFRGLRMWHRTDIRGLRFDATGRPCFAEMFVFGTPQKSKLTP